MQLLEPPQGYGCQGHLNASSLPLCYSGEESAHYTVLFFLLLLFKSVPVLHEESFVFKRGSVMPVF